MTDSRLRELRALVRQGQLPADLHAELLTVVKNLVRRRLLPPAFAPYGQWNDEAAEEIFADWYTNRLLARGHLQLLVDQARSVGGFRKLCERSLRQHLYNSADRSQARNLFLRLIEVLEQHEGLELMRDATQPQDRWWRPTAATSASEWQGNDDRLIAEGWGLGDFVVIRYRADAKKLAPVLATDELRRFVDGLFERTDSALSPRLIMRVLEARFDLGDVTEQSFEAETVAEPIARVDIAQEVALAETARAIVAELTARQLEVLRRSDGEETIDEIAAALGCSVGTIVNERSHIGLAIHRFSEDESDHQQLLRIVCDLLYRSDAQ